MNQQQLTRRETRLLVVLPAVLIACGYAFFFERPHRTVIDNLRNATATAMQNTVSKDQLRSTQEQIILLTAQIKLEQRHAAAATRPSLVLPARWTTPAGRLDALAFISTVFDSQGLFIVSTSRLADATSRTIAPKSLQDFAEAVSREGHAPIPEVWRVDVMGSYADVLAALGALKGSDAFIVPLGVSMEPIGQETSYRRWSLWFWV